MDANKKKRILKSYSSAIPSDLLATKTKAEAFIATPPDGTKPEDIQDAKDVLEVVNELIAAPLKSEFPVAEQQKPQQPQQQQQQQQSQDEKLPPGNTQLAADRIAQLESELSLERARVRELEAKEKQRTADEVLIGEKMSMGLNRDQAVGVIRRQREHDLAKAKRREERLPNLIEAINSSQNIRDARQQARSLYPDLDGSEFNAAVKAARENK